MGEIEANIQFAPRHSKCRLQVRHVASMLGIKQRMVRHLAQTGKLRGFKVGPKIWYFMASDVERFRAEREARRDAVA